MIPEWLSRVVGWHIGVDLRGVGQVPRSVITVTLS